MLAVEVAAAELAAAEAHLQAATEEWEQAHGSLLEEQATLGTEIELLKQQRVSALENVAPENRELYDTMRKKKTSQPVAKMQGDTCAVCGVEQTMAVAQEVRRAQGLVLCSSCGRILVEASA